MFQREHNTIRPRKNNTAWTIANEHAKFNGNTPIFRLGEMNNKDRDYTIVFPHNTSERKLISKDHLDNARATTSKARKNKVLEQLETYCDKTTLHGLRYVGDTTLTLGERIFWLLAFSVAIGFAAYYISNIYKKWNKSPVIISFSPFDASLGSIPFPAITICNMNQAKKSEAEKILKEGTSIERKLLDTYCNGNSTYDDSEETKWEAMRTFLVRVGQSCTDILKVCHWKSAKIDCENLFNNDLTDEGLCCSFNRLPPTYIFKNSKDIAILNQTYPEYVYDWTPEKGFSERDTGNISYIPLRPPGAGAHLGLSLVLDTQVDQYYCSSTNSVGFKIILANPIETPKMADFGVLATPGSEVRYNIVPSIREATDALRTYTSRNCKQECQSNYTLELCKCVPYFLPRNRTVKICEKKNEDCVNYAKVNMELTYGKAASCNCLPACFEVYYDRLWSSARLLERKHIPHQHETLQNISDAYFRTYSQRNCILECQSNYTLLTCLCIPYFLPKNKLAHTCGKSDELCVLKAKQDMELLIGEGFSCNCLPACFELSYDQSASSGKLSANLNFHHELGNMTKEYFLENIAILHFFFRDSKYTVQVKSELYGFTEILSNVGGLLGLFMGFSFLSIVECFYFLTLRLFCTWFKKNGWRKTNDSSFFPFTK